MAKIEWIEYSQEEGEYLGFLGGSPVVDITQVAEDRFDIYVFDGVRQSGADNLEKAKIEAEKNLIQYIKDLSSALGI